MEKLTLHIPYQKEEFLRTNSFRLKLAHKPSWRRVNGAIILSSLFLLFTILLFITNNQNSIFVIITSVFCIVTILFINSLINSKKKYLTKLEEIASIYELEQMDCNYEFKDDGIFYGDKEKTMSLKWDAFKHCISHNEYIIFSMGDSFENAYFLSRRQIDKDTCDKILKIAATKLPLRTISIK